MQVVLVTYRPNGQRVNIPLRSKSVLIGRSPRCTVRIPSGSVSREHCELIIEKDRIWVKDLGAANGTYVNGDKIKLVRVLGGDVVGIGEAYFGIQVDGDPEDFPHIRPVGPKLAAGIDAVKSGWPAAGAGEGDKPDGLSDDMIAAMLDDEEEEKAVSLDELAKGPVVRQARASPPPVAPADEEEPAGDQEPADGEENSAS